MAVDIEIPFTGIEEAAEQPSKTYRLDIDNGHISGTVDGIEAVEQAIRKAIITQRFCNLIYDSDYGCEAQSAVHSKGVTHEYLEAVILIREFLCNENPQFNWGFKKALAMSRKIKPPEL